MNLRESSFGVASVCMNKERARAAAHRVSRAEHRSSATESVPTEEFHREDPACALVGRRAETVANVDQWRAKMREEEVAEGRANEEETAGMTGLSSDLASGRDMSSWKREPHSLLRVPWHVLRRLLGVRIRIAPPGP